MRKLLALSGILAIAGCVPVPPVVSDFNGSSVKVQTVSLADPSATPEALAEANRICQTAAGKRAEYASTRSLPDGYTFEHLYLCL